MGIFLIMLGLAAIIVWLVYYFVVRVIKRNKPNFMTKYLAWIGVLIFIIGFVITPKVDDDSSSKTAKSETSQSVKKDNKKSNAKKEESKKSSSSKSSSSVKEDKKITDINKINEGMANSLAEDQKFANSGNENYAYAPMVKQWQLRKSGFIYILVDAQSFFNESNVSARNDFVQKVATAANGAYSISANDFGEHAKMVKIFADGFDEPIAKTKINHDVVLTDLGMKN